MHARDKINARRAARDPALAVDEVCLVKDRIDALLARIVARSADHFGVSPDDANWGHVGDLRRIEFLLNQVAEAAGA